MSKAGPRKGGKKGGIKNLLVTVKVEEQHHWDEDGSVQILSFCGIGDALPVLLGRGGTGAWYHCAIGLSFGW